MKLNEINQLTMKPNIAVVRIEDDTDGTPQFAQLPINNGVVGPNGKIFTVAEDDDYRTLNTRQIVLAHFNSDQQSSRELIRFTVGRNPQDGEEIAEVDIRSLPYEELKGLIQNVIANEMRLT